MTPISLVDRKLIPPHSWSKESSRWVLRLLHNIGTTCLPHYIDGVTLKKINLNTFHHKSHKFHITRQIASFHTFSIYSSGCWTPSILVTETLSLPCLHLQMKLKRMYALLFCMHVVPVPLTVAPVGYACVQPHLYWIQCRWTPLVLGTVMPAFPPLPKTKLMFKEWATNKYQIFCLTRDKFHPEKCPY